MHRHMVVLSNITTRLTWLDGDLCQGWLLIDTLHKNFVVLQSDGRFNHRLHSSNCLLVPMLICISLCLYLYPALLRLCETTSIFHCLFYLIMYFVHQLISMDSLSRWTAIAKTWLPFFLPLSWQRLWRPWIPARGCLIALSTIITTPVCTPYSTSPSVTVKLVTCQPWVAGKRESTTLRQTRYSGIMGHLGRTIWMGRVWQNQTGTLLQ